jgi:hypothetical protein
MSVRELRVTGNAVKRTAILTGGSPMRAEGGAAGFVDIVARLLAATFTAQRTGEGGGPFAEQAANM